MRQRLLTGAALALLTTAEARAQIRPVSWHVRAVPFYTRTARLGGLPVYPILAPAAGQLGILAGVLAPPPGGNPETLLTGSTDDRVLVDNGSVWQRKALPDCDDSGGNHLNYDTGTNAFSCGTTGASSNPFDDGTAIIKGSADATKLLRFEVDGFTTGMTRVLTPPNADGTIATLAGSEIFSNKTLQSTTLTTGQSFIVGASTLGVIGATTVHTPDTAVVYTGTTSNGVHFKEFGDAAHDGNNCSAGTSSSADPFICLHSRNQTTTEWVDAKHNGTDAVFDTGAGVFNFQDQVRGPAGTANTMGVAVGATGYGMWSDTGATILRVSVNTNAYFGGSAANGFEVAGPSGVNFCSGANLNTSCTVDAAVTRAAAGQVRIGTSAAIQDLYSSSSVEAVTTTKTVTAIESGETYISGDADGSTVTLLDNPSKGGLTYTLVVDQAQSSNNMAVAPSAGETIISAGSSYSTSCTATAIGASITVRNVGTGSGAKWAVIAIVGTWTCS